jgi:hypothetical protein
MSFTDSTSEAISYSFTKSLSTMSSQSSVSSFSSGQSRGGGGQIGFSLFGIINSGDSDSEERRWDSSSSRQSTSSSSSEAVKNSFKFRTISQKFYLKLRHKKFKSFCFTTTEKIQSFENYQNIFFCFRNSLEFY